MLFLKISKTAIMLRTSLYASQILINYLLEAEGGK